MTVSNSKEIVFLAQEDPSGGYIAWAQGYDIYTQADSWEKLLEMIKDAAWCHFDEDEIPEFVHAHFAKDMTVKI